MKSLRFSLVFAMMTLVSVGMNAQERVRLTNLPHIYIETFNGRSITSKTSSVLARMWYVDENDVVTEYDSMEIRGRGNSTWNMAKKPYKIKFNKKEKFLGKGYANCKPWTLLANCADKSLIRNAITSEMGRFLGLKNNPAHKFVDLTLNGVYQGNYQISDHVDVRPHRVNVVEQDYPLTEDSNITGGYLLEIDGFHDGNYFSSNKGVYIRIHYPDEDEISTSQQRYITGIVNSFERSLFSTTFDDEELGYRALVDSTSLVAWFLATEICANIDGYFSVYFYKQQDDPKLYFGPLWDYDIAYDNDTRITPNAERLMTDYGYGDGRTWMNRMWQDPWFCRIVAREMDKAMDNGLVDFMYAQIDSLAELLDESQQLNYEKWGIKTKYYHEVKLYSSYDQYLVYIKDFIDRHTAWLVKTFHDKKPKDPTPLFEPDNYYYKFTNKGAGTAIDILDQDTVNGSICAWTKYYSRKTQDWVIKKVGKYFHITSRCGGMALHDPSTPNNVGMTLALAEPDTTDVSQLWSIVEQGTDGYYNLKNRYTGHCANLSGGSKTDGTLVLSYTSDSKDATSNNRLWKIEKNGSLPEEPDAIEVPDKFDYALAYNPQGQYLHFGTDDRSMLDFIAEIYTTSGMKVGQFRANENGNVAQLPDGIYVVTWTAKGVKRSVKFIK